MELDLTRTHTLLAAYEAVPRATSFLKDRYFPTNAMTDVFNTEDVLVDYKENGRKVAPFVLPIVGGVPVARDGFTTVRFTPPLIAPQRNLSLDDLKKRGFGEAIFSGVSPAQRKTLIVMRDLQELDEMTTRREEVMAAETLINDKCVMKHITATDGTTEDKVIQFHDGDTNPYQYAPAIGWDASGAKIMQDIHEMVKMLTQKGLPAEDLVMAGDVADAIINDPTIQKLLDNNRMNLGGIAPAELEGTGAAHIGTINVYGKLIRLISYTETYENDKGVITPYIPNGTVILTAPAAGRGLYGAVTQLEWDGEFYTYPGRRVPKFLPDPKTNQRPLTLSSCPVLIPKNKGAWISAKVTDLG